MDKNIEHKIKYEGDIFIEVELPNDTAWDGHATLFHRTDYWKDGSQTEWYGLELTEAKYKAILDGTQALVESA